MTVHKKKQFLLGEALIQHKMMSREQLEEALKQQQKTKEYLGQILIRMGIVSEPQIFQILSEQLGIRYIKNLKEVTISAELLKRIPAKLASHYQFLPVELINQRLTICVSNPLNFRAFDEIRALVGYEIEVAITDPRGIEEAIKEHYGIGASVLDKLTAKEEQFPSAVPVVNLVETIDAKNEDASVTDLVNQFLMDAYNCGASDIHLEPSQDGFAIRYRIDGILQHAKVPSQIKRFQMNIISRIKIMAGLDIAEKRLPQDGRILVKTKAGELDLRVSVIPSHHGEAVVIRILRPGMLLDLERLGFESKDLAFIRKAIQKPTGIILLTGPTGSGKTTTLYAFLRELNSTERKIITIEDPIEYQITEVLQIQVQPKIGLTFATCLRHALRHDPDVMMIGEIRDQDTAQIASRAALTGHLVFSTLHTRDAAGAITRLVDIGVEPYLVASSVEVVVAQRLIRLLCRGCKRALTEPKKGIYKEFLDLYDGKTFYEPAGCERCRKTGYQGRIAIQEILGVDDEVRELIVRNVSTLEIRENAIKKGMKQLYENGLAKAAQGITSIDEILRVAPPERQIRS